MSQDSEFSLKGKQIKFDSAESIKPYVDKIEAASALKKIDFSGNTIGIDASAALAKALLLHRNTIEEIDFSDLYTGRLNTEIPQSLGHLLPALLQFPNLKVLNLSDNAFGLQTIDPIEDYLSKAVSLEHLYLSNNGMGPFAGSRIGESLLHLADAKKQKGLPSLRTFVCGRNRLENGSVNHLAVALRNHPDLEEIRLFQNGIRPAGVAKLISQGLSHNKKLEVLDLQDNTLTTVGGKHIAKALPNWEALRELNLNDALLKSSGSLLVVKALGEGNHPQLKTVKLQYNELEEDSLEALASAITENKIPSLQTLELNGNRFPEDAEVILQINEACEVDELDELEELDSDEEDDEEEEDILESDLDLDELERKLRSNNGAVDELADALAGTTIN